MSRFSKADAEARGWVFVHDKGAENVVTSEVQSEVRHLPRSIRAEKIVSRPNAGSYVVNEEAETLGLLLERIHAFERHLDSLGGSAVVTPAVAPSQEPEEGEDDPRTVIVDGGRLTEEEWASRSRNESLYDGEKMVVLGASPAAVEANDAASELAREIEDADKAAEEIPHEQIEYDTADNIDSPGQSAGGTLVVREGEASLEDVSLRRDAEKHDAESERVQAALAAAEERKALEEGSVEAEPEGAEEPAADEEIEVETDPAESDDSLSIPADDAE